MITDLAQRWDKGTVRWRAEHDLFDPRRYEVALIPDDAAPKRFILANHYSGTYPSALVRVGLYDRAATFLEEDRLVGVAVFSYPMNDKVLSRLPCDPEEAVELGRLVLLDRVEFNAESYFVSKSFELLRRLGYRGVVSFSDPVPRPRYRAAGALLVPSGETVFQGHRGGCYQALGCLRIGDGTPRTLRLFPDGTVLSARGLQKLRTMERGWAYVVEQISHYLVDTLGLSAKTIALPSAAEPAQVKAWAAKYVPRVTRPLRHKGNLCYVVGIDGPTKKHLVTRYGKGRAYPKLIGGSIVDPAERDGFEVPIAPKKRGRS